MGRSRFACPGAHHPSQKSARCPLTDPAHWLGWDRRAPAAPGACSELRHVGALREGTTHGSKGRHQKTAVLERSHRAGDGRAEPGASLGPRTPAGAVRHAAATVRFPTAAAGLPAAGPVRRQSPRVPAERVLRRTPDRTVRLARGWYAVADVRRLRSTARDVQPICAVPAASDPGYSRHRPGGLAFFLRRRPLSQPLRADGATAGRAEGH